MGRLYHVRCQSIHTSRESVPVGPERIGHEHNGIVTPPSDVGGVIAFVLLRLRLRQRVPVASSLNQQTCCPVGGTIARGLMPRTVNPAMYEETVNSNGDELAAV